MKLSTLVLNSTRYYWKSNLSLLLAISLCAAIITGALTVGDSVRHSLMRTAEYRLGESRFSVSSGDSYFTQSLANRLKQQIIGNTCAIIGLDGTASANTTKLVLSKINIWGIDKNFGVVTGSGFFDSIPPGEVIISDNVALGLNLKTGESIIVKFEKLGTMPKNSPFVPEQEQYMTRRLKVFKIADKNQLGRFGLRNIQTAPFNVFISIDWLNKELNFSDHSNLILVKSDERKERIQEALINSFTIEDLGLQVKKHSEKKYWVISSDKVFIKDQIIENITDAFPGSQPVVSYFANTLQFKNRISPFSFVSTFYDTQLAISEIAINSWLAEDLKAQPGDTLKMDYYTMGLLRDLEEHSCNLVVSQILPMQDQTGDDILIPDIPGLSDTEKCSEWETGIPIDFESVRDKDEKYWYDFGATPKVFVDTDIATKLWKNRFGTFTSVVIQTERLSSDSIENRLTKSILPAQAGFQVKDVKSDSEFAANNSTDFSQLFIALSFFIIVSAIILIALLFLFTMETRSGQIGLLSALGYSMATIRKVFVFEALIISFVGALLGLVLSFFYTNLIFIALAKVWNDIVRTSILELSIEGKSLALGFIISIAVSIITVVLSINRMLKLRIVQLQKKQKVFSARRKNRIRQFTLIILILIMALIAFYQIHSNDRLQPNLFFAAGSVFLIILFILTGYIFEKIDSGKQDQFGLFRLILKNIVRNRRRSLIVIVLLGIGSFLVITTGANKKDLFSDASNKSSGTGGFTYIAESTLPVLKDLNNSQVKKEYGINSDVKVCQFRKFKGDDASCLNLNRISNPQILGVDPGELKGRFSFVTSTSEFDRENPWASLNKDNGGLVPAIADQTVIQWGLGKKVGDTLKYQNEAGEEILIILTGGLAGSVFQGNVIISEDNFIKHFPSVSGSNFFLIDSPSENPSQIEEQFYRAFRDLGWIMTTSADKLAEFKSVENTYLNIFLILGTFGLLLGTIGLAIVLIRSINDRQQEVGIYAVSGYSGKLIRKILVSEYVMLLVLGCLIGLSVSLLAVFPNLVNRHIGISTGFLVSTTAIIIFHGILWIVIISSIKIKKLKLVESLRNE